MKSFKKVIAGFLMVAILGFFTGVTSIANAEEPKTFGGNIESNIKEAYYESFTGTVKSIDNMQGAADLVFRRQHILLENETGAQVNFVISNDTLFLDEAQVKVGAVITGFYKTNAPAVMIFPPQYFADIVAINARGRNVKVDLFDKDLVSADGTLKLNVADNTEIVLLNGPEFKGDLADKTLVAIYGATTKSIPAQTTPSKVIVLLRDNDGHKMGDVSNMDVLVKGNKVAGYPPYLNEYGVIMVQLGPIAIELGAKLTINDEQLVKFGEDVSFKIGEDKYTYKDADPIELGTVSVYTDEKIYVPLDFFTKVANMNNAYVARNQIVID